MNKKKTLILALLALGWLGVMSLAAPAVKPVAAASLGAPLAANPETFQTDALGPLQADDCASAASAGANSTKPLQRLVRLTVTNKSGRAIEMRLSGSCLEEFYYLRIPEGDRFSPAEMVFTVTPDIYISSVYYVELWDPVYGNQCSMKGQSLDVRHNVHLIVFECESTPVNAGEPPAIVKYAGRNFKRMR